jgi:hypothetical protein
MVLSVYCIDKVVIDCNQRRVLKDRDTNEMEHLVCHFPLCFVLDRLSCRVFSVCGFADLTKEGKCASQSTCSSINMIYSVEITFISRDQITSLPSLLGSIVAVYAQLHTTELQTALPTFFFAIYI